MLLVVSRASVQVSPAAHLSVSVVMVLEADSAAVDSIQLIPKRSLSTYYSSKLSRIIGTDIH